MKWIQDLPDDFTQDFRFRFLGVQDEEAWLTRWLELGVKDWSQAVTLGKNDILKADQGRFAWTLRESDVGPDPVECVFSKNLELEGLGVADCVSMDGDLVRVSFFEKDLTSLSGVAAFAELRSLSVNACEELVDITGIGALQHLVHLGIAYCPAVVEFQEVSQLSRLQSMSLEGCDGLVGLPLLKGMTALTRLNLSQCSELDSLAGLSDLVALESMTLSECEALSSLAGIEGCSALRKIDAADCSSLANATGLSELQNLEWLNLHNCKSLKDVSGLSGMAALTVLDLSNCSQLEDVSGLAGLTGLTSLDLGACEALTDVSVLSGLTELNSLDLSRCKALTDVSGLWGLTGLTALNLSWCKALTDVSGLSGLTGLTSLYLMSCDASTDLSGLSGLTGLTVLDLSNSDLTMADLSEISQLHNLEQLDLRWCTGLSAETLWRQVSGLSRLRSVEGMGAALDQLIPFNSAILRKAKEAVSKGRGDILEHAKTGAGVGLLAKRLALKSLAVCPLEEASLQGFLSVSWSDTEWEIIWRAIHQNGESFYSDFLAGELDKAKTVASLSEMMTDPTGSDTSMAPNLLGWLRTVADGLEWRNAGAHVTAMSEWLPVAELKSGAVELLMAMRQLGLVNEERTVLSTVTDKRAREFTEMVEYRLATNHAKSGRWKDAMRHIQRLPQDLADEVRSDVIARWSAEVPDQVAEWMSGFHRDVTREKTALELASTDSSIASSSARHLILMDLVPNRDALESFIQQMASALPDDPWVVALQDEILSAGAQEAEAGSDLMALLESEEVAGYVKPKKLQALLDGFRNEEGGRLRLEQMAVALLLEHKGLIDEDEREELLALWTSNPDGA